MSPGKSIPAKVPLSTSRETYIAILTAAAIGAHLILRYPFHQSPSVYLIPLFAALAIPSAKRIHGGPFADVDGLPTNYVIDRSGVLRYAKSGAFQLDDLNSILVPLMKDPAPGE